MADWSNLKPKMLWVENASHFERAIVESVSNPSGAFFRLKKIVASPYFWNYNPTSVLVTNWNPTCRCSPPDSKVRHPTEHVGLSARQLARFVGAPQYIVNLVNSVTEPDTFENMDLSQSIDILRGLPDFQHLAGSSVDWFKRDLSGTSLLIYWVHSGGWKAGSWMLKGFQNQCYFDWNDPEVVEAFELIGALLAAQSGRSAPLKRELACDILCAALSLKQRVDGSSVEQSREAMGKLRQMKDKKHKLFVKHGIMRRNDILGRIHPRLLAQTQECCVLKRLSYGHGKNGICRKVPKALQIVKTILVMANGHLCPIKRRLNPYFFRKLTKFWAGITFSFKDFGGNTDLVESLESVHAELLTWVIRSLQQFQSYYPRDDFSLLLTEEYERGAVPILYPLQFLILLTYSLRSSRNDYNNSGYLERLAAELPQLFTSSGVTFHDILLRLYLWIQNLKDSCVPLVPLFDWILNQLRHPELVGRSYQQWLFRPSNQSIRAVGTLMEGLPIPSVIE